METLVKADIFFFISSIAVVVVSVSIALGVYYVIGAIKRFEEYAENLEESLKERSEDVKGITEEVKEITDDIRESFLYNLLFKKKKKRKSSK